MRVNYKYYKNYTFIEGDDSKIINALNFQSRKKSIVRFFNSIIGSYSYNKILIKQIGGNERNYSYIHCHDISTLSVGVKIKQKFNVRLIYDAHELYEEAAGVTPIIAKLYRNIHKKSQIHIDGFITINQYLTKIYKAKYPKLPTPVIVMNATKKIKIEKYDGRLHEACGVKKKRKIILFQGGFSRDRGIQKMLAIAEHLNNEFCLVFMGWGALEEKIMQYKNMYPEMIYCIPPAPQDELMKWTAGAYIGLIPYENANLNHKYCTPNKLWEFPSAGVPIMASSLVMLKEVIQSNNIGWVFDLKLNPRNFVKFLMESIPEYNSKAKACSKFSAKENWEKYEKNILKLYKSLK